MALMCGSVIDRCCARGGMLASFLYNGVGSRSWSELRECIILLNGVYWFCICCCVRRGVMKAYDL
jgi:hypothetical protein